MENFRVNKKMYSTVLFGKYEYSDGGLICKNDIHVKYPLEWMILEVDDKNKKMLLLAKYIVDVEGFANCPIMGSGYNTSWEKSYLRYWLNSDFINTAFTAQERGLICTTHISPEKYLHKKTLDRVFLLSEKEYNQFLAGYSAEAYWSYISQNSLNEIEINAESRSWWLRTVFGDDDSKVKIINFDGQLSCSDSNVSGIGIRPAMWVKLKEHY